MKEGGKNVETTGITGIMQGGGFRLEWTRTWNLL